MHAFASCDEFGSFIWLVGCSEDALPSQHACVTRESGVCMRIGELDGAGAGASVEGSASKRAVASEHEPEYDHE